MMTPSETMSSVEGQKSNKKIIIAIVTITLVITVALLYVFDIGSIKGKTRALIDMVTKTQSQGDGTEDTIAEKAMEELQGERDRILYEQERLKRLETEQENRQRELDAKEQELLEQELKLQQLEESLSSKVNDINEVSKLYEQMDAQRAAQILLEIDSVDRVVSILKNIKRENTAEILENMDPKSAANITNMMLD